MKKIEVYDKPMCCSTGVCGPEIDPILPKFAADLEWLKSQGYQVERFNLAQQPQAFIENSIIHNLLSSTGTESLPVVVIDGEIASKSTYPTRDDFKRWLSIEPIKRSLPISHSDGGGCGGSGCC